MDMGLLVMSLCAVIVGVSHYFSVRSGVESKRLWYGTLLLVAVIIPEIPEEIVFNH
jgi:hypothetical protein